MRSVFRFPPLALRGPRRTSGTRPARSGLQNKRRSRDENEETGHEGNRRYLELKGYEVLEEGWCHGKDKVDYIIDDYDFIAFVFGLAVENAGKGIPAKPVDRKRFERLAAMYLTEHPELVDCDARADEASILIPSDSRAIIGGARPSCVTPGQRRTPYAWSSGLLP